MNETDKKNIIKPQGVRIGFTPPTLSIQQGSAKLPVGDTKREDVSIVTTSDDNITISPFLLKGKPEKEAMWNSMYDEMFSQSNNDYKLFSRKLFVTLMLSEVEMERLNEKITMIEKGDMRLVPPLKDDEICIILSKNPRARTDYKKFIVRARRERNRDIPLYLLADPEDTVVIGKRNQVRVKKHKDIKDRI